MRIVIAGSLYLTQLPQVKCWRQIKFTVLAAVIICIYCLYKAWFMISGCMVNMEKHATIRFFLTTADYSLAKDQQLQALVILGEISVILYMKTMLISDITIII